MKQLTMVAILAAFVLSSCYYDNKEELYQFYQFQCDTTAISYAADIEPVINAQCISCHSGSAPDGNVALENYEEVKASAIAGSLYGTVTATNGYNIMPPAPANTLTSCTIDKIDAWIKAGMPNN